MSNKIGMLKYYLKRGGLPAVIGKCESKLGIIGKRNCLRYQRLYSYFENLSPEKWEDELAEQIRWMHQEVKYNLDNPATFNEKIQWMKVHSSPDALSTMSRLADKYAVREWVAQKIGEEYLVPLVGGPWDSGRKIEFEKLPEQFVLKANHGSGMNMIVRNKGTLSRENMIKQADAWIHTYFGWNGMEMWYFRIPRKLIAEQYIEQADGGLSDYKIFCFSGEPKAIMTVSGGHEDESKTIRRMYKTDWTLYEVGIHGKPFVNILEPRPASLDKMLDIARILSKGFPHVRVDLYDVDGKIYFGEMTFAHQSGFETFKPESFNVLLGSFMEQ